MSTAPSTEKAATPRPSAPWLPPWSVRIPVAICIIGLILNRVMPQLENPPLPWSEAAAINLLSLFFLFVATVTLWLWFGFGSGYSALVQRLVLIGGVLLVVGFFSVFRIKQLSGSLVPEWEWRWQPVADRALGGLDTAESIPEIDLKTTTANDFPEFLGPGRRCWIEDPGLSTDWTTPPKCLWRQPIGAGWSAFAAVNGYAVTMEQRGDEEWISCYEIATGKPVWGHAIVARHEDRSKMGGIGPRSTPTIAGGRVFAQGATGVLRCLDGGTGKLLWQEDLLQRYGLTQAEAESLVAWGRSGSPLVVDDLVIVPAGGKSDPTKKQTPTSLAAFHVADGKLAWEAGSDQISYCSPELVTLGGVRHIVSINENTVTGHDIQTGRIIWGPYPWPGNSTANASASQALLVGDNQLLLSKGYQGGSELLALASPDGGKTLTADSVWKNHRVLQTKHTNATIIEGHAYALSDGVMECVDLATGERKWKKGRYGHGQILGVGRLILVQEQEGGLVLLEANPDEAVELGSFPALDGITWNNLCLYGKRLLVRNAEEAACFELP